MREKIKEAGVKLGDFKVALTKMDDAADLNEVANTEKLK